MIIRAFQIKNYRSIVDSGICFLSHDNITALIGQNESGKTSVLEALRSFYEGRITDDVLRSDQTFPEITCIVDLDNHSLGDYIDFTHLPPELHDILKNRKEIMLQRKWLNALKSTFSLSDPEILQFFENLGVKRSNVFMQIHEALPALEKQLKELMTEQESICNGIELSNVAINKYYTRIGELTRMMEKRSTPELQTDTRTELETCTQHYEETQISLKELMIRSDKNQMEIRLVSGKLDQCRKCSFLASDVDKLREEVRLSTAMIQEKEHLLELCSSEKESKNISKQLDLMRMQGIQLNQSIKDQADNLFHMSKVAGKLLGGSDVESALQEANIEMERERNYHNPEEIGKELYPYLPVFEFFEDFSSLLPNKIDLVDLLNENQQAEGYKAARNFLGVAGLNADFFREKNHRILKQKIENLNSDITVDFQDYWHQQVGENNKIRLHFELEHYDNTVPEKSGKPYLEFWIKDKQERLYPKQRSRGVRWFLSFYLELKATARENLLNRVLLIDEPGLSLHARAQEDVLKVFEDLKGHLQIIYCTHSPHLIDLHKLYRIMAVQRANDADENSETMILDARSLSNASSDTLSPVYSLMGTRLNDKQFIYPVNNVIVSDTIIFYYLDTMARIFGIESKAHFIPASGAENIPVIANLLFGWKIDFGLLIFGNGVNRVSAEIIRKTIFAQREELCRKKIREYPGLTGIEDLFSIIDFKRHILRQRIGITEGCSAFIESNKLSRSILAIDFCSMAEREKLHIEDFDEETQNNFTALFDIIKEMIDN